MKQKILASLKTKFAGVDDATLGRIADQLAVNTTKEEDVQTAVNGVTFAKVLENYGDARATQAQKTAIATYEKKHNLKDGKPIETPPTPPTPPTGGEDTPEWAKALIEQNNKLTERLNKMETDRTTNSRKKQFNEAISKLPDNLKKVYGRTAYDKMTDEDFATLMGEVKTEVEGFEKESAQRGAVFGRPFAKQKTGSEGNLSKEDAASIVDKLGIV